MTLTQLFLEQLDSEVRRRTRRAIENVPKGQDGWATRQLTGKTNTQEVGDATIA